MGNYIYYLFQVLDSTYIVTYVERMTWSEAELYCRSKGMYLWVINSHTERKQFMDLFTTSPHLYRVVDGENLKLKRVTNTIFIGLTKIRKVEVV